MKTKNQDLNENEERERRSEKRWNRFYFGLFLAGALLTLYALNGVYDSRKARAELVDRHPVEYREYLSAKENRENAHKLLQRNPYHFYAEIDDNVFIDITNLQNEYGDFFTNIRRDSEKIGENSKENIERIREKIEELKYKTKKRLEEKAEPIKNEIERFEEFGKDKKQISLGLSFTIGLAGIMTFLGNWVDGYRNREKKE